MRTEIVLDVGQLIALGVFTAAVAFIAGAFRGAAIERRTNRDDYIPPAPDPRKPW